MGKFRRATRHICMFQYRKDANRFYRAMSQRLKKFNLQIAPDKTRIIKFNRWNTQRFQFLGFEFYWGKSRKGKGLIKVRTSGKRMRSAFKSINIWCKANRDKELKWIFYELNRKLIGHYNYYGVRGNYERLKDYQIRVEKILKKWLNRRSQKGRMNWQRYRDVVNTFKLAKPRIRYGPDKRNGLDNIQLGFHGSEYS